MALIVPTPTIAGNNVVLLAASFDGGGPNEQWLESTPEGVATHILYTYGVGDAEVIRATLTPVPPFHVDAMWLLEGSVDAPVYHDGDEFHLAIESGNGFEYYAVSVI